MFGISLLSFRSPRRNQETDRRRLSEIWKAVNLAISGAESERKGLRTRIEKARRSAAFLADIGDSDLSGQAKLKTIGRYIADAEARARQLKDHVEHLRRIEAAAILSSRGTHVTAREAPFEPIQSSGAAGRRLRSSPPRASTPGERRSDHRLTSPGARRGARCSR